MGIVMSDTPDLRETLKNWPYDPENECRVVLGEDGRQVLQVRTPLGIEQMEMDGRPDGARPHGMESALEFQLMRLATAQAAGQESDFELDPHACAELFNEGTLYYLRYVRLFQVRDWPRTIRDTTRNLRAFDLVHRYAQREEDQLFLEKWRPYILRVQWSAAALAELDKGLFEKALRITREGLEKIEELADFDDETFKYERDRSVTALGELAEQIEKNRPLTQLERLEKQLHRAVDKQEFERAAELRDQIRELKKQHVC
jgi:hypothetical protein